MMVLLTALGLAGQPAETAQNEAEAIHQLLAEAEEQRHQGQYEAGLDLALEAVERAHKLKDPAITAEAHYQTGILYHYMEQVEPARAHLEIGLSQARMAGLRKMEGDLKVAQGVVEWKLGNLNLAMRLLEEAVAVLGPMDERTSLASISNNLGIIHFSLKQYPEAIRSYLDGLEWLGDIENDRLRASLFSNLAESLMRTGNWNEAEDYLQRALEIEQRTQEPHAIAYTYLNFGELRALQGRPDEAIGYYHQALDLQLSIDAQWPAALTRIRLAEEHLKEADTVKALEVLAPGYEAVKELNALTLLRDYAGLYSRIYTEAGMEGRARYYQELEEWFISRIGQPEPAGALVRPETGRSEGAREETSGSPRISHLWIRLATLVLLVVLIGFLMVENFRLRRTRRISSG